MSDLSAKATMNSITKKVTDLTIENSSPTEVVQPTVTRANIPVPSCLLRPIATRSKFLLGTGPTNFSQRVSEALCKPIMGLYMDETHQVHFHNRSKYSTVKALRSFLQFADNG